MLGTLKDYHDNSYEALEERLKADGICVFGHGDVIKELIHELTSENIGSFDIVVFRVLGYSINDAEKRIALFREEDYDAVKNCLSALQCNSYNDLNQTLEADKTNVYGEVELLSKLIVDLAETKNVSKV